MSGAISSAIERTGSAKLPGWLLAARARAAAGPAQVRAPLLTCIGQLFGSAPAPLLERIAAHTGALGRPLLKPTRRGWALDVPTQEGLPALAQCLRDLGQAGPWRDELLTVRDERERVIGKIERGAVRTLGIATQAVHLVGLSLDGRVWVQQRALSKPNDPGLWDTLMGGMVGADELPHQALVRETWEEAGFDLQRLHSVHGLHSVRVGGQVQIDRPSAEVPGGGGYMRERIDWFVLALPDGVTPANQDGEVAQFALLTREQLWQQLAANMLTLEATLVLGAWLFGHD